MLMDAKMLSELQRMLYSHNMSLNTIEEKRPRGSRKGEMSEKHKEALARGREQGRIVRRYLVALESHRPKRGRKRTLDKIEARIEMIDAQLEVADALKRLQLTQERLNLENELGNLKEDGVDLASLEDEFVQVAKSYSESKGLRYEAWRAIGVDPKVLKRANITKGG